MQQMLKQHRRDLDSEVRPGHRGRRDVSVSPQLQGFVTGIIRFCTSTAAETQKKKTRIVINVKTCK